MRAKINWKVVRKIQELSAEECDAMLKKVLEEPNCKLDIKEILSDSKDRKGKREKCIEKRSFHERTYQYK